MIIKMDFEVTQGRGNTQVKKGQRITLPVDVDQLSPLAQRVVKGIRTTDNNNPLSQVRLRSFKTLGSLMDLARSNKLMLWSANITVPAAVDTFLPGLLDQPEIFAWHWGKLAVGETAGAYMDRNARAMEEFGAIVYLAIEHFSGQGVRCAWR